MRGAVVNLVAMSITAGYVIVVLILARILLRRLPRIISYSLWAVAGFRLVSPVSFSSPFSLVPYTIRFRSEVGWTVSTVATSVWVVGFLLMAGYGMASATILRARLKPLPVVHDNIHVLPSGSPFVFGLFHPQIYIPSGLSTTEEAYVVRHETTHIRRHDHLVKVFAYCLLCVHWFNPLVWVAFVLMEADMEISCDERVLAGLDGGARKDYSRLLLSLASRRRGVPAVTAFGEGGIKARIVHVLGFRKHSRALLAVSLCLTVLTSAGLIVNRAEPNPVMSVPTMAELDVFFDHALDLVFDDNGTVHLELWTRTWHDEGLKAEADGYLCQLRLTISRNMPRLTDDWNAAWYQSLYMSAAEALSI